MRLNPLRDPAVMEAASYGRTLAAWTQVDTWSTHVFILGEEGGEYQIYMFDVDNPAKGRAASMEATLDRLDEVGSPDEEHDTIAEALNSIEGGWGISFEDGAAGERLRGVWVETVERERLDRMSTYQRKVYLRERGILPPFQHCEVS